MSCEVVSYSLCAKPAKLSRLAAGSRAMEDRHVQKGKSSFIVPPTGRISKLCFAMLNSCRLRRLNAIL